VIKSFMKTVFWHVKVLKSFTKNTPGFGVSVAFFRNFEKVFKKRFKKTVFFH
jgi:hypothetical protein